MESEDIDKFEQEEEQDDYANEDGPEDDDDEEGDSIKMNQQDDDEYDEEDGNEQDDFNDTEEQTSASSSSAGPSNKKIVTNEIFVDEGNYEKFDNELRFKYLKEYHPECIHNNYDEMFKKTFIKRNENGLIENDELHRTIPFLTKYEKTKIIGLRIKQLNSGAKPFIDLKKIFNRELILDNCLIAEKELEEKKLPFIIARPINNKNIEYWNLKDLELIH